MKVDHLDHNITVVQSDSPSILWASCGFHILTRNCIRKFWFREVHTYNYVDYNFFGTNIYLSKENKRN